MTSLRVFYAAGPGDVAGTFRRWKQYTHDEREAAETYSGMFFDVCRRHGFKAYVISSNSVRDHVCDENITVVHVGIPWHGSKNAVLYHLGQVIYAVVLTCRAIRFRSDVAVVMGGTHWFLLSPLRWYGVAVVPSLHCAFWPSGFHPHGKFKRFLQWMDGVFWKYVADATIAISPECERQVRLIAEKTRGPIHQRERRSIEPSFPDCQHRQNLECRSDSYMWAELN